MKNTYNFEARHYSESPAKCKEYYSEHEQTFSNKKVMIRAAKEAAAKIKKAVNCNVTIFVQIYKNGRYLEEITIKGGK